MYYRARRPQGLLMLWRRSTACTALVEGIRHSALCAVLIDGIALTYNPPLHNRRTIVERAEQGWQYSMVHVEYNGNTNLWRWAPAPVCLRQKAQERHAPPCVLTYAGALTPYLKKGGLRRRFAHRHGGFPLSTRGTVRIDQADHNGDRAGA